jgi:AsmA-like C-terminal region
MRKWLIGSAVLLLVLGSGLLWANARLKPMLRERLIAAIRKHYQRNVEVKSVVISLLPRVGAVVEGLVIHQKNQPDLPPFVEVKRLMVTSGLVGLFSEPLRIRGVVLEGLRINVPPKQHDPDKPKKPKREPPKFVVREMIADGTLLQIFPKKKGKEPLAFNIHKLTLHSAGTAEPMRFKAILTNPKPPGDIHSSGQFGPWENEEPSLTPVSGEYRFQHADLSEFKGISGLLSSEGRYHGLLGRIEVDGWTDTPEFTVKISGNPVSLQTQFHAIVDGTDGDTHLDPVNAQFGRSTLVARGAVHGEPGVKGKTVSLDVTVSSSRVEDMLRLAVKGAEPMTGDVSFATKFELPPGEEDISERLYLKGNFGVDSARFSKYNIQSKVDELSQRARGKVDADASEERHISSLGGNFELRHGVIAFKNLTFAVPGATVRLDGQYKLRGELLDFRGTLRTEAKVSEMTTGIKSFLLKLADPLFKKKGAGAVIPIKITGPRKEPKFGLDIGGAVSRKD